MKEFIFVIGCLTLIVIAALLYYKYYNKTVTIDNVAVTLTPKQQITLQQALQSPVHLSTEDLPNLIESNTLKSIT